MSEAIKEYHKYLEQLEMIVHPNLYNAFLKIHNEIVKAEIEKAKLFKPAQEWIDLKILIDQMKEKERAFRPLYMKQIIKQIDNLPSDKNW